MAHYGRASVPCPVQIATRSSTRARLARWARGLEVDPEGCLIICGVVRARFAESFHLHAAPIDQGHVGREALA